MGCFDRCLRCLSLVPWGTLIATVVCWAGTALFCGTGHEAMAYSYTLLNISSIPGFQWNNTLSDEAFKSLQYATYGIAAYMLVWSILLFVDGVLSTRHIKSDYEDGCKTSFCGLCAGIFYITITFLTGAGWLVMTCFAALPLYFFVVAHFQCTYLASTGGKADWVCLDFVQAGLMHQKYNAMNSTEYGRLCGTKLDTLCKSSDLILTYQLFTIAFVGSAIVVLSMKQYLMCLTANFAYLKMTRKHAAYEDAKFREEMELNDIINTARSNERLTYK